VVYSGKRNEKIKFIKKNRKRFGEGGRRRRTIDIENRYSSSSLFTAQKAAHQ